VRIADIVAELERIAPTARAAEWDNTGLLLGEANAEVSRALLTIDVTDAVLDEALKKECGLVIAYHPPLFKPISRLTADSAPLLWRAARQNLALYALHTALDVVPGGANDVLAEVLGLRNLRPLEPLADESECKVVTFTPADALAEVAAAGFRSGAGRIGEYSECAFFSHGLGTFRGSEASRPAVGQAGRSEVAEELRLEMICPLGRSAEVVSAIRQAHPYEEPPVEVYPLRQRPPGWGLGRVGVLAEPATLKELIARIKDRTGLEHLLLASGQGASPRRKIRTAACCCGSCGSSFRKAVAAGAQLYLTGEMRHHDALAAAAAGMHAVCLGHSNSERMVLGRLVDRLAGALPELTCLPSRRDRDPFEIV
jgi:dinuclear metal center YbgI/SA1388 family protein